MLPFVVVVNAEGGEMGADYPVQMDFRFCSTFARYWWQFSLETVSFIHACNLLFCFVYPK